MGFWDWWPFKDKLGDFRLSPPPPPPSLPQPPPAPAYRIESAIELMKGLPLDENPELVLRVVRKTLQSTGVSLEEVIASAQSREATLSSSIDDERTAIEQLEREIAVRRSSQESATTRLEETRSARQRLQEALQNETRVGPLPAEMAHVQALARAAIAAYASSSALPAADEAAQTKAQPPAVPKPPKPAQSVPRVADDDDALLEPTTKWVSGKRIDPPTRKR